MTHRLYAALTSLLLVAALPLTVLGSSHPTTCDDLGFPAANKVDTNGGTITGPWGSATWIDNEDTSLSVDLNDGWQVEICIKAGTELFSTIVTADTVINTDSHGISHASWKDPIPPTTTTGETTSSTSTSTTATTAPSTTTTSVSSTTSSSQGSSTSTSTIESTTTSNPTTTSSEGSTSTSSDTTTSTSVSQTTDPTLPYTGTDDTLGLLALAFISGGVFLVTLGRSLVTDR